VFCLTLVVAHIFPISKSYTGTFAVCVRVHFCSTKNPIYRISDFEHAAAVTSGEPTNDTEGYVEMVPSAPVDDSSEPPYLVPTAPPRYSVEVGPEPTDTGTAGEWASLYLYILNTANVKVSSKTSKL